MNIDAVTPIKWREGISEEEMLDIAKKLCDIGKRHHARKLFIPRVEFHVRVAIQDYLDNSYPFDNHNVFLNPHNTTTINLQTDSVPF